jgi:DNA replication and repair protein RecF
MPLTRLALTDFRNHADALLEPGPGFVLLAGPNGAGKTNILEAVSMLAPGRGLRQAALGDMARHGGPGGWAVAASLSLPLDGGGQGGGDGRDAATSPEKSPRPNPAQLAPSISIGTATAAAAPERRLVRINGASAAVNSLSERLAVLWLTPAMDRLFTDSPGARRRFLDRLVLALEPGHAHHAARYEAAMRARNKLLAGPAAADPSWLAALEAAMAEHGALLGEARGRTVSALAEALAAAPDGDFPRAGLALAGWDLGDLAAALRANRARDSAAGRATEGPHRHDLAVTDLARMSPAALGSTGEQKALLIGLVLAHAELVAERRGAPPLLLLDEVAAHLDPARRAALFARLEDRGQVWMTATEESLFAGIARASRFNVVAGRVEPA